MARLLRWGYTPMGTFGTLTVNAQQWYTVERPWRDNEPYISCIPEGTYPLRLRRSPIVERTTAGQYLEGWEVCDVPGRTFIMIHPGCTISDTKGCICPGMSLGYLISRWAVMQSKVAFDQFMQSMPRGEQTLKIEGFSVTST